LTEPGIKGSAAGTLFVVATPIGNRDDLSPRARQTLEKADLIAAEDTRHTGRLLSHFGIKTRQMALHDHNEASLLDGLLARLEGGQDIALVSDAGTPLISDPGYRLLRAAHERGISVSPIPGPAAVIAALSVAGLPTDRFCFEGFLPAKRTARLTRLRDLVAEDRTVVFYESVHRIRESVGDMADVFGADRPAFLGRELTKLHEQCVMRTLADIRQMLDADDIPGKGEFVVAVHGRLVEASTTVIIEFDQLLQAVSQHLPGRQGVDLVATLSGRPRNEIYRQMLAARTPEDES
jgi:16S rRNA (cytidine1402-2'-O)-methyltransferase